MIDQSSDKADDQVDPVTVLPLARPSGQESTLLTVPDSDQQTDHSHRPVPPVAAGGIPYRYKVRLARRNVYASTADEVLSLFIEDYRPRPEPTADIELEQVKLRGEHCIGVIVNHVAQAMIAGELSSGDEAVLQRSAEYGTGRDPITAGELPRWDHRSVPMLLMGDLYAPAWGRFDPPLGNVRLIWPGRAERYLSDLAGLGLIVLSENPSVSARPLIELRGEVT